MPAISVLAQRSVALLAATTLSPRAVIDHDRVVGFPDSLPSSDVAPIYKAYRPTLKVVNGCVPFPVVDSEGNTGGGLKTSGSAEGDCDQSPGQVYVRGENHNGNFAVMYAWYFPKISPEDSPGHRHDWESIVVWLKDPSATDAGNIAAVCTSTNGGFGCSTTDFKLNGASALISYDGKLPANKTLSLTDVVGGQQPLVAWESLPEVAMDAMQTTDFGEAIVPMKDATFSANLDKAKF